MTVLTFEPTTAPSVASGMVRYGGPMMSSSPYVTVSARIAIEATGAAPPWLPELENRVNQLLSLTPNWDTYGAQSVRLGHVVAALRLLQALVKSDSPMPTIVPTSARGVQFEWQAGQTAVEARVDDVGAFIYVEDDSGESEGPATSELASRAAAAVASAMSVA